MEEVWYTIALGISSLPAQDN